MCVFTQESVLSGEGTCPGRCDQLVLEGLLHGTVELCSPFVICCCLLRDTILGVGSVIVRVPPPSLIQCHRFVCTIFY